MDQRPIENVQKKLIHLAIAQLRISDEIYRDMLQEHAGVDSCLKMSFEQASTFIDDLVKKGFKIKKAPASASKPTMGEGNFRRRPQAANLVYLPTRQQLALIDHLRADIRWKIHDGYYHWINRFLDRDVCKRGLRTGREAQRVIEALKGIRAGQQKRGIGA
jgi:hypothetical protein